MFPDELGDGSVERWALTGFGRLVDALERALLGQHVAGQKSSSSRDRKLSFHDCFDVTVGFVDGDENLVRIGLAEAAEIDKIAM